MKKNNKKYDKINIDVESLKNAKIKKSINDEIIINSIGKNKFLINIEEGKQNSNIIENN